MTLDGRSDAERDAHLAAEIGGAERFADRTRSDPAAHRIAALVDELIVARGKAYRQALRGPGSTSGRPSDEELAELAELDSSLRELAARRSASGSPGELDDADELAAVLYAPIAGFAERRDVPLATRVPLAVFGPPNERLVEGLRHTKAAAIFLPRAFFANLIHWPALAHQIGHDVVASTRDAATTLRAELGLPVDAELAGSGVNAFGITSASPAADEFSHFHSLWFETLFSDVFATLSVGPAHLLSMCEPSASGAATAPPADARAAMPRHLRVLLTGHCLELCGEEDIADELASEWVCRVGSPSSLTLETPQGSFEAPLAPLVGIGRELVSRLYRQPLATFGSFPLSAIPGVDWGPAAAAEARRVAAALRAGRIPQQKNPRTLIAGALLAYRAVPAKRPEILRAARAALTGRRDVAQLARRRAPSSARDAFLLYTVLGAPRAHRRRGFLDRRG